MAYKYHSISKSHSYLKPVSDISVYVNNEYCNDASKEIIRASSIKFGYGNYITSLNDFDLASNKSTKQKIDLITRRRPSNAEISEILKNFEIVNYYTVEDGIGNYINEDFFSHTTFDYKYREVRGRIKNILGLLLKLIKFQKIGFFLLCNKFGLNNRIDLPLIARKKNEDIDIKFINIFKTEINNINSNIKVLVLGSIYSYKSSEAFRHAAFVYASIEKELNKNNIRNSEVLYIAHPRADSGLNSLVKSDFGWVTKPDSFMCAEELICSYPNAEIWSVGGNTSQVYALNLLGRKCTTFFIRDFSKHPEFEFGLTGFKNSTMYLESLGAKKVELDFTLNV